MNRWIRVMGCVVLGVAMLFCGLLLPIHLRAVDAKVLEKAGRGTPSLVEQGQGMLMAQGVGTAQMLLRAAQMDRIPGSGKLEPVVSRFAQEHPDWKNWGGSDAYLATIFKVPPASTTNAESSSFVATIIQPDNRRKAVEHLRLSDCFAVQQLLYCRSLTNTVIFPAPQSSSGQAFESALLTCGLLVGELHLTTSMSNAVLKATLVANRDGNTLPLEQVLMDYMSLGQRLNWGQLTLFVTRINDTETLHLLADDARKGGDQLPLLFAAVQISGNPAGVARYLATFDDTGMKDISTSLRYGAGGIKELLQRNQRVYESPLSRRFAGIGPVGEYLAQGLTWSLQSPRTTMGLKWFFYLAGGFFLALALHFTQPALSSIETPLRVRGFHVAREILFALAFLLMVLLLSEPFLAQENQRTAVPIRLRIPMVGVPAAAGIKGVKTSIMNQPTLSLMTLLVFFLLQGLLYISCLVKLSEVRKQHFKPGVKLKLLENEEHLFDAGLYLGFAGTIVSLIFVSLGVIKFSLMAAYSSTSFGIIFVSIFKIFHLRPMRRKLLLEADAATTERPVRMTEAPLTQP